LQDFHETCIGYQIKKTDPRFDRLLFFIIYASNENNEDYFPSWCCLSSIWLKSAYV